MVNMMSSSWIGTVVAFASQQKQIEEGFMGGCIKFVLMETMRWVS